MFTSKSTSSADGGGVMTKSKEIKNYYFIDIDFNKGPSDPENFYEDFRIDVGEAGSDSVTNYSFFVCTPKGIQGAMKELKTDYLMERNLLIVPRFDMELILRAIRERIDKLADYGLDVS
jgi:hypothetical protein